MSDNSMDALFGAQVKAGDNQLKNIAGLIRDEGVACDDLAAAEAMAAEAKERRSELRNKLIPTAMLDACTREFTTDDGVKAKIAFATDGALGSPKTEEEYAAREAKYDAIVAAGGGEIVQLQVAVNFPKERFADGAVLARWLDHVLKNDFNITDPKTGASYIIRSGGGLQVTRQRAVNHMTLGKWIKERMGSDNINDHLPASFLEKLGIWYGEIAKITRPKPKA